jgi:hypothetical protein
MLSKSTVKPNLLKKLAALCGVAVGTLSAVPALAQSTLAQVGSVPAPVIMPLSDEDPAAYLNRQNQPIPDTVTPTSTAPDLSVIPYTNTPIPLAAPSTPALTPLATPLTSQPTTSIILPTLTPASSVLPTPSVIPTTTPPESNAVLTITEPASVTTPNSNSF